MIEARLHVKLLTGLVALGMAVVASGCAVPVSTEDTTTNLVVGLSRTGPAMKEINSVIRSRTDLNSALDALRNTDAGFPPARLGDVLDTIDAENSAAPGGLLSFSGLGGVFTHVLMGAARAKMDSSGDYDRDQNVVVTLSGLITGYTFDPTNNSGTLLVETTVVTEVDGVVTESVGYVWDIRINPNGYDVVTHSGSYFDPFPGTLAFDDVMLERIDAQEYNTKLWAYGAGSIRINSLTRDPDTRDTIGGTAIVPSDPVFGPLLRTGPDSCIDIMFEVPASGHIPTNLAELRDPSYSYCLGRCAHPAIINSK